MKQRIINGVTFQRMTYVCCFTVKIRKNGVTILKMTYVYAVR